MKKTIKIGALLLVGLLCWQSQTRAQTVVHPTKEKENDFVQHLWYGGGFTLGFSSSVYESLFQVGVAPMVGYKIFDQFSIGPRASLVYSSYKSKYGGDVQTANPVSWSLAAFARYKVFRSIFAHVEYEFENSPVFTSGVSGLEVLRRERYNFYVGAGYNSGGVWGYEILLLYNTTLPQNDLQQPFSFRFGFTHNF